MESKICRNCQGKYIGSYCPDCGQKFIAVPYDLTSIYRSLLEVFEFDRGFFVTIIKLFVSPRIVIDTYLSGNTKRFNNPFRYFVTFLALIAIISFVVSQLAPEENRPDSPLKMLFQYLFTFPLFLFVSTFNYLLFRTARNFLEHLIISLYEVSQFIVIVGFSIPLSLLDKNGPVLFYGPSMVLYHIWFNYKNFGGGIVKSFLLSIVSIAVLIVLMSYLTYLILSKPGQSFTSPP